MSAETGQVGVVRGTALFVAAIIGPGILTLPAIAAAQAGPASLLSLAVLLVASAPVALTFVALRRAAPGAGGIAGYAAGAFGPSIGRLVAAWFTYGIPIGVAALGLIGGQYVAEAFGGGKPVAVSTATVICVMAIVASVFRRAGTGNLILLTSAALVVLVLATAVASIPYADVSNLSPVAPNGFVAVAASAVVLTWVLTGWEAVTNFNDILRNPGRTLPRVTAATLVIVGVLYAAVAIPEILVLGPTVGGSEAPIAALLSLTVGPAGAVVAAVLAVALALGNSLAYVGSLAEMGAGQARNQARSAGLGRAKALVVPALIIIVGLSLAAFTPIGIAELVSVCAGSQVPVLLIGVASALKLLAPRTGRWWLAVAATAAVAALLIPAAPYLIFPAGIALGVWVSMRIGRCRTRRRCASP